MIRRRFFAGQPILSRLCQQFIKVNASFYSSVEALPVEEKYEDRLHPQFTDNDITQQASEDTLKVFSVPVKETSPLIINSYHKKYRDMSDAIGDYSYLLRKEMLDILDTVRSHDTEEALSKLLIYGPRGSGKSMCLLHAMQYAHKMGWIVVHVPSAYRMVWTVSQQRETLQSTWNSERIDQPGDALLWLKTFEILNKPLLSNVRLSKSYEWGKRETTEAGEPLSAIIMQGMSRGSYTTDAVGILLKELRLQKEFNVLLAIEQAQGLYGPTNLRHDLKRVQNEQLSLPHHFRKLIEKPFTKGCCLLEFTRTGYKSDAFQSSYEVEDIINKGAKIKREVAALNDFTKVLVNNFSKEEYISFMKHQHNTGWITKQELTDDILDEVEFYSRRNPIYAARLIVGL